MASIRTTVQNRRIQVPAPDDLPDGTEVVIVPVAGTAAPGAEPVEPEGSGAEGFSCDDVETWLRAYESLEPLIFTEEERARTEADRQARKARENERFSGRAQGLADQWQ